MFYSNSDVMFKIIGVFHIKRDGKTVVAETERRHTAIAYRLSGESCFHTESGALSASDKSVIYIPAGVDYTRSGNGETLIIIHLECHGDRTDTIEIINNASSAEPFFRKLFDVWSSDEENKYNRSMGILYSIFSVLQNLEDKNSVPDIIRPGVELLKKSYKNPELRVSDLAKRCYISEVHFRNIFRQHFGESPQQTLGELRFQYAGQLINSGYYTAKEIALLSGFTDVKYFRTAFKKRYGITIGEYAKQRR